MVEQNPKYNFVERDGIIISTSKILKKVNINLLQIEVIY